MTVSTTTRKTTPAAGDSANKAWSFSFRTLDSATVKPYLIDNSTGSATLITADFSVSLNPDQDSSPGGTVTYPVVASAITSSYSVQVVRESPNTQLLDLTYGGNFSDEDIEKSGLDPLAMKLQEVAEAVARAIVLRAADTSGADMTLPELVANGYITVNATADGLTLATQDPVSGYTVSTFVGTNLLNVANAAAFRAAISTIGLGDSNTFTGVNTFQNLIRFHVGTSLSVADVSGGLLTLPGDGNYYNFTDGSNVTGIANTGAAGAWIKIRFVAGGNVFTHNATTLNLPTGADITTAAGDEAEFVEYNPGQWRVVNYQRASGAALTSSSNINIRDTARDLNIFRFAATQISASASEVILQSSGGTPIRRTGVSQAGVVLTTAAGAATGGLDTGAIAPNTWYYIWLAWDGVTEVLLSSLQSTAAALSTGRFSWTHAARIGAFRTDGSSNIIDFDQIGDEYTWETLQTIHNTSGALSMWTGVSQAAAVPPIAKTARYVFGSAGESAALAPKSSGHAGEYDRKSATGGNNFGGVCPQATRQYSAELAYLGTSVYYYFDNASLQHISVTGFTLR